MTPTLPIAHARAEADLERRARLVLAGTADDRDMRESWFPTSRRWL
jgi:hypothetical protein